MNAKARQLSALKMQNEIDALSESIFPGGKILIDCGDPRWTLRALRLVQSQVMQSQTNTVELMPGEKFEPFRTDDGLVRLGQLLALQGLDWQKELQRRAREFFL